jgi:hypothetical protein
MSDVLHPAEGPESDDDPNAQGLADGDFVVAATADDQIQSDLIVAACEEAGIPAIAQSPRSGMVGTVSSPVEHYNILVRASDLERARGLIAAEKSALGADQEGAARAAEEEEAAEEQAGKSGA